MTVSVAATLFFLFLIVSHLRGILGELESVASLGSLIYHKEWTAVLADHKESLGAEFSYTPWRW